MNDGEVGDEGKRDWRILSCKSTPCNTQSIIVWMVDGARNRTGVDGAQGDEALEGGESWLRNTRRRGE